MFKRALVFAFCCAALAPAVADTVQYSFSGTYNGVSNGTSVPLAYTGMFSVTDPLGTDVRPANAADVSAPAFVGVWAGDSTFYQGATNLQINFANGASVSAPELDIVVNHTMLAGPGSPYPLGLSVQLFTRGFATNGMSASLVCPNGTLDAVCDDSGVDPLYRRGDAADVAVKRMTGVYFAFFGDPLSAPGAGVPQFAETFGASGGGLGVYSVTDLGEPVTTLTQFQTLTATSVPSSVPEPSAWALSALGIGFCLLRRRQLRAA